MKKVKYKVVRNGIADTAEAPKGKDIFYKCKKCEGILPSTPKDNVSCLCGNIGIDKDMNRLFVGNYEDFVVLESRGHHT